MSDGPARRQLLKAAAASSIVAPVAGCLGTLETADGDSADSTDDGSTDPAADDGSGSAAPRGPPCELGADLVAAFADGDYETAVSYYPFEHLESESNESVDETEIAEEFENSDWPNYGWVASDVDDVSCECTAPFPDDARTEFAGDVSGEVGDVVQLRYSVTYDATGTIDTEPAYVNAVEIDGDWYGILDYGHPDLCGTGGGVERAPNERDSETDSAAEQPLEPARWEDVDEVVLEADDLGWVGVEPAPIADVENPTLFLFDGREYTLEWRNADGLVHDLAIRDEADETLAKTDLAEGEGESASLTVEATRAMDRYVCEPHAPLMNGDIVVESE